MTKQSHASTSPAIQAEGFWLEPSEDFVMTPYLQEINQRALAYLAAGYPVHFSGPAGTGKTTLAFLVASQLGRPVMLIHGNDELGGSDLVGGESGYRRKKLVDNYIHSVFKTEEEMHTFWADSRLTRACRTGSTLIYDEFTRSRPETNNVLLSVLEERILGMGKGWRANDDFVYVHPDFRAIFTSNPLEYAGVHRMQDALMDRLVTLRVDYADEETETSITQTKSGIDYEEAHTIVSMVREMRKSRQTNRPSLRASVMIGKVLKQRGARARWDDSIFLATCCDVLGEGASDVFRALAQDACPSGEFTVSNREPSHG